jgi:hypothetical protein
MNVRDSREHQAIQYLLGELTEAEQARLEERYFQDAELSELLSEIEDDLIDQYVREELSPRERERFEHHFLISERRREKVAFAKSWLEAEKQSTTSKVAQTGKPVPWWKSMLASLSAPRPALAYSLGAFALLFLLFGLWQWSEMGHLRKQIAAIEAERDLRAGQEDQLRQQAEDERKRSDDLAAENEKLAQELAELKSKADDSTTDTPNTEQPPAPALLSFILSPGARGSEAPRDVVVPRSTQSVRLQLNIDPADRYSAYQARLQTASGTAVRSWNSLSAVSTAGRLAVFITVPAKSLSDGQYELTLSGVAAPDRKEDLGYYYFNLRKE